MSDSRENASCFSCILRQIEKGFLARPKTSAETPCFLEDRLDVVGDLGDDVAGFPLQRDEAADDRGAGIGVQDPE